MIRTARLGALTATIFGAPTSGCAPASVDAVAVWLDEEVRKDGARRVHVYDRGDRRDQWIHAGKGEPDGENLFLQVVPGGHGFWVSPFGGDTVWINLEQGTRGELRRARWGPLQSPTRTASSGLALFRGFADETSGVLLPTLAPIATGLRIDAPPPLRAGSLMRLRSASAAPVLFWVELANQEVVRPEGQVVAFSYPASDSDPLEAVIELGRGEMTGARGPALVDETSEELGCMDGLCVSPEGDALMGLGDPCTLRRFRWANAPGQEVDTVPLPPRCAETGADASTTLVLVAALAADLVVLEDPQTLYRADLGLGTWTAVPKLGAGQRTLLLAERGRAAIWVANDGAVTRADQRDIWVVSAERSPCAHIAAPIVSPSGAWVVMSCHGEIEDAPVPVNPAFGGAAIVRVSALGLERFEGVPLRALAVDDGGNVLMYSFGAKDKKQAPRGLYVLDGGGTVSRVGDLEPTPAPLLAGEGYFSAEAWVGW